MKVRVKVPKLGLTIEEVNLSEWEKKVGDRVEFNELIATVEADKANFEINAPAAGTLAELLAEEGDTVEVGGALAVIETD